MRRIHYNAGMARFGIVVAFVALVGCAPQSANVPAPNWAAAPPAPYGYGAPVIVAPAPPPPYGYVETTETSGITVSASVSAGTTSTTTVIAPVPAPSPCVIGADGYTYCPAPVLAPR